MRDVVEFMQGWLLRVGSFLERAKVDLGMLSFASVATQTPSVSSQLVELDVHFTKERDTELYGCFSRRLGVLATYFAHCDRCLWWVRALSWLWLSLVENRAL